MKTAVEWLVEQFNLQAYIPHIEQAKEMEKEEKHAEYMRGWKDGYSCKSIKNKLK